MQRHYRTGVPALDPPEELWPPIRPLRDLTPPPNFPTKALPDWVRDYVEALAETTQTPTDLAGMFALAALATSCQGRIYVEAWDGFVEPAVLYVAVALPPGERKSAVHSAMTSVLTDWEQSRNEALAADISRDTVRLRNLESEAARTQKEYDKAAASGDRVTTYTAQADAEAARFELDTFRPTVAVRLYTQDATPEAVGTLLAQQGEHIAVLSAEGGILDLLAGGVYSDKVNFDIFLKGHTGEPHRVDRKGRAPEVIRRARINIGLAIQPDVLRVIGESRAMRGRGLLARFLFSVPSSRLGSRNTQPAPMPTRVSQAYQERMVALADSAARMDPDEPRTLSLSAPAREALVAFMGDLEPRLGPSGDLAHMTDWAGKWAGTVLRIAAVFAVARDPQATRVEADDLNRALEIAPYLLAHAQEAFGVMTEDREFTFHRRVIAWIERKGLSDFTLSDVQKELHPERSGLKPQGLADVMEDLMEAGYIRFNTHATMEANGRPGRPRGPVYRVNPAVHQERAA